MYIIIVNLVLYTYINRVKIAHQEKSYFLYKKKKTKKIYICRHKNVYVDIRVEIMIEMILEKNKELLWPLKANMRRKAASNVIRLVIIIIELTIQL